MLNVLKILLQCISKNKNRGASAIEFAILAPLFMIVFVAILNYSLMLFAKQALQKGLEEAAEKLAINRLNYEYTIRQTIASRSAGLIQIDPAELSIKATSYASLSDAVHNINASNGPGMTGNVVIYEVTYNFPYKLFGVI